MEEIVKTLNAPVTHVGGVAVKVWMVGLAAVLAYLLFFHRRR